MTENMQTKSSPFLSLFRRKKKVNGTVSSDNLKDANCSPEKKHERGANNKENKKTEQSHTLPIMDSKGSKKKKTSTKGHKDFGKSVSLDALIEESPAMLVEALETMGDEKPSVARSIPKHAKIIKKEDTRLKNCLFEQEVYDTMLSDSLRVCEMLQSHLDDCIVSVRAKSPEPCSTHSLDGRDSGRGASTPSSTMSTSPAMKRPIKTRHL